MTKATLPGRLLHVIARMQLQAYNKAIHIISVSTSRCTRCTSYFAGISDYLAKYSCEYVGGLGVLLVHVYVIT